ncbi:MAG TPA: type IIL restriction-modification enzyme MmeI [Methylocella sp.]
MRLDWNDIKARAAKFAEDWNGAQYDRGETQTFYNEFFDLFGVTRRRVASFEHGVNLPDKKRGYLDLFWKGKLLVEQKSAGRSLTPARRQALDYFPGLREHELPPPPNPSAAGKSKGPAAPSRRAVTMAATISNELISTRVDVLG